VSCLGARSEATNLDLLLPLVSHPDWSVRAEAIQVLAERRVTKAVPTILRRLETEQDGFVRDAMLRALERLEG
jgi:HEAT repeat protein